MYLRQSHSQSRRTECTLSTDLHLMEVNPFTSQERKTIRKTRRPGEIHTARGINRSTKERWFTSRSWWKSLLKYCPLDDCTMSWDTPTRGNQEKTHKFTKGKKTIECCPEEIGIPRRGHKAIGYTFVGYESKRARPRHRKPRARKQSGRDNVQIAETISQKMWSATMRHRSAIFPQSPSILTDAGGDPRR